MPYRVLPARLRRLIPAAHGQRLFRNVFNSQQQSGKSESVSFASAWAALESAGYAKNEAGQWVKKAWGAKPLYGFRPVLNAEQIVAWAKSAGFGTTLAPDDMHVTVVYSRQPFSRDLTARAEPDASADAVTAPDVVDNTVIRGGKRVVAPLGDKGAVVLKFESDVLQAEHAAYRNAGASWDYPSYMPHVTISYAAGNVPESIAPYDGDIVLGGIEWRLLDDGWSEKVVEKADYRGRKVELDKPFRLPAGSSKKFGVYVRAGDKVKRVTFGDPNMEIRRDDPEARANFRSRHSCDTAKDKTSARYWSCRMWENDISVSEMTAKRQVSDDAFTFPDEARARSVDMGLEGAIHVAQMDGNAVYMPGATHEDYLKAYESLAGIEAEASEPSQDKSGLLATAITAIIGAVMKTEPIHIAEDARILKLDDEQRIVWGWASVSTKGGTLVVDRQGDVIEPAEMVKMANDFMLESRTGKSMHGGNRVGEFIHSLPLTNELAKALGIETDREGWIVGMKVYDEAVWADVKAGKYAGFSIGGRVREKEEIG